jgi:plasmid stability protein
MANQQIHLRIPVSANGRQQLRVLAAQRGISIAELVRQTLTKQLTQEGVEINLSEGLDTWGGPGRMERASKEDKE